MSKERARRRAERVAAAAAERTVRQRRRRRRRLRRAVARGLLLVPRWLAAGGSGRPRGRAGSAVPRRSAGQRTALIAACGGALVLVWLYAGALTTKIALTLLIAAAAPVAAVLTFDRRT